MATLTDDELEQLAANYKNGQSPATDATAVDSVNAAGRIFGRTPVVGTPETDQTNLNMAAAMDRADAFNRGVPVAPAQEVVPEGVDIGAVNQRRNQILQGVDPDAPAIFVNPKRRAELNHELGTLTNIAHDHSLEAAHQTTQAFLQQQHIKSSNDYTAMVQEIGAIPFQAGTPEYHNALLSVVGNHADGANTVGGREIIGKSMDGHRQTADVKAAIEAYRKATGMEPGSVETTATGGVNIRGKTADASGAGLPKIPNEIITNHTNFIGERAATANDLETATAEYNVAAKKNGLDSTEATDAKKRVDAATGKIRNLNVKIDAIQQKFPSLAPKAATSGQPAQQNDSTGTTGTGNATPAASVVPQYDSWDEANAVTRGDKPGNRMIVGGIPVIIKNGGWDEDRFDTEATARSAGRTKGDIIMMKNPATGKYQRARLD